LVGTAEDTLGTRRNHRTANRAQIDVEVFEFDADSVIEEVLDARARRPAERRRRIVAKVRGLRADSEVAYGAAGGRIKEEVGPSVASTDLKVLSQSILVWHVALSPSDPTSPTGGPKLEQAPLPLAPDQSKSPSKPSNTQSPKPA
jgi:hypothetical protein